MSPFPPQPGTAMGPSLVFAEESSNSPPLLPRPAQPGAVSQLEHPRCSRGCCGGQGLFPSPGDSQGPWGPRVAMPLHTPTAGSSSLQAFSAYPSVLFKPHLACNPSPQFSQAFSFTTGRPPPTLTGGAAPRGAVHAGLGCSWDSLPAAPTLLPPDPPFPAPLQHHGVWFAQPPLPLAPRGAGPAPTPPPGFGLWRQRADEDRAVAWVTFLIERLFLRGLFSQYGS